MIQEQQNDGTGNERDFAREIESSTAQQSQSPTLESRLSQAQQQTTGGTTKIILLPLDLYVGKFEQRYRIDRTFQSDVHTYLGLNKRARFVLGFQKIFSPSKYLRHTSEMIKDYAKYIYDETKNALEAQNQLEEAVQREKEFSDYIGTLKEKALEVDETVVKKRHEIAEKEQATAHVVQVHDAKIEEEKAQAKVQQDEIRFRTDAQELVKAKLTEKLAATGLVKIHAESGVLEFNDTALARKLEDVLLEQILDELAQQGDQNVFNRIQAHYAEFVTHHDQIENIGEFTDVNWTLSTIHSRMHGYRKPTYPYLIVNKYGAQQKNTAYSAVDTAFTIDGSGSMSDNKRFEMAKKTCLSTTALMRKLNPNNKTYLSVFADGKLKAPVTSVQLAKNEINPNGGTPAHLGLRWLRETLKSSPAAIAYFATDGAPDDVSECVREAQQFIQYPNIMLRIFYIDPDSGTESKIREIGRAAGPTTKISVLKNYQLPGGVVKDVGDALGSMVAVGKF